jgi:hypothetical protein
MLTLILIFAGFLLFGIWMSGMEMPNAYSETRNVLAG